MNLENNLELVMSVYGSIACARLSGANEEQLLSLCLGLVALFKVTDFERALKIVCSLKSIKHSIVDQARRPRL